jgi:hypothetical protein
VVTLSDIENARTLLADHIKKTPLLKSPDIAAHPGLDVYLKAETSSAPARSRFGAR